MFSKLASLMSIIALAAAAPHHQQPAAQFPAGVNPALCPGFPICDNAYLHNPQARAHDHSGQWNPAHDQSGQWNAAHDQSGQWNPAHDQSGQWNPAQDHSGQWNPAEDHSGQWNPAQDHSGQWNPAHDESGQWNPAHDHSGQWNAAPAHNQWNAPAHGAHAPAAPQFPAGVNPHSCPNYPYCDTSAGHAGHAGHHHAAPHAAPLPGYTERQYPAGVSPHQCPNFPYCS